MKRLRYAAELVEPADDEMEGIARYAKELQTLLGEHQDAIVAANFLATISEGADGEAGGSAFTYGVLVANELHRAADIRASLHDWQPSRSQPERSAIPTSLNAKATWRPTHRPAGSGRRNRRSPSV
jgi:hypothetical protein